MAFLQYPFSFFVENGNYRILFSGMTKHITKNYPSHPLRMQVQCQIKETPYYISTKNLLNDPKNNVSFLEKRKKAETKYGCFYFCFSVGRVSRGE
jgi:hypothetical protein